MGRSRRGCEATPRLRARLRRVARGETGAVLLLQQCLQHARVSKQRVCAAVVCVFSFVGREKTGLRRGGAGGLPRNADADVDRDQRSRGKMPKQLKQHALSGIFFATLVVHICAVVSFSRHRLTAQSLNFELDLSWLNRACTHRLVHHCMAGRCERDSLSAWRVYSERPVGV